MPTATLAPQLIRTSTRPIAHSYYAYVSRDLIAFQRVCFNSPDPTMPTPESESFLAKKPKVPPTFNGVDYDDNKALKAAQDAIIREQWVRSMMARLVREEMGKCYYREGVNHLEKCGHLRGTNDTQIFRALLSFLDTTRDGTMGLINCAFKKSYILKV